MCPTLHNVLKCPTLAHVYHFAAELKYLPDMPNDNRMERMPCLKDSRCLQKTRSGFLKIH